MSLTLDTALPIELQYAGTFGSFSEGRHVRTLNLFPLSKDVCTGGFYKLMFWVTQCYLNLFGGWLF